MQLEGGEFVRCVLFLERRSKLKFSVGYCQKKPAILTKAMPPINLTVV
jgi:hypothetical protein